MEHGKIIFLDVDGTLVDYKGRIPESAAAAVRLARQQGHKVYICTGRSRAEVYSEIWDIGLDGMIGGNGNYVEDSGQVLMHRCLSAGECRRIVDWLHERGLEFYLECNAGLFGSENFETAGEPVIRMYSRRKGAEGTDVLTVRDAFPDLKAGTWGGAGETALFGDLALKDIDKAYAMDILLDHLNASAEDAIAFGDARVDIPMLQHSSVGGAMGNGGKEIRAMADYVADDVECDRLWKAFSYLGLI